MAKVSLRAYNREIETMIDQGHLDEAIANCRHILKTFPKHLETYRLLGKAYLEYKRHPEAVDIFSRVLAAVPDDFVAHVGMSIIRDDENKLDDAIRHMERAFETQPSNAAIQSELQRLYSRRDGVQPPRIRMTRGALAHMYVQGELYPQAISEIKSVLKEDGSRADMQALLALATYRSGLKSEAAEAASATLRTHPFSLDANRVLFEILGSDRAENAHAYRQRVVDLDPYAAHVTGTVFESAEVPDAAVGLERLDWNGQPVGLPPDWSTSQGITAEGMDAAQPDWLRNAADEPPTQPPRPVPMDKPASMPGFDLPAPEPKAAAGDDDIPEFLREAGWGESTGAFEESLASASLDEFGPAASIEKGDLPDWVKAMAPAEPKEPAVDAEEELPDWINKIGVGVSSSEPEGSQQPDWMSQADSAAESQPAADVSGEALDWLGRLEQPAESSADAPAGDAQADWLSQFGQAKEDSSSDLPAGAAEAGVSSPLDSTELPDWLSQSTWGGTAEPPLEEQQPDWMKPSAEPGMSPASDSDESVDWLKELGVEEDSGPAAPKPESSFVPPQASPAESPVASTPVEEADSGGPVASPGERDLGQLGVSEQEREDSFAWLESLAAKQGASEGLLTTPEERLEEEPDWVKRARGGTEVETPKVPADESDELGKSEQERDDSFAWLETLAARQGAGEGLLTKPEERSENEPEWVKKARETGPIREDQPMTPHAQEQPAAAHDTAAWLKSLDAEETDSPPASDDDPTGMWIKGLDEGGLKSKFPAGSTPAAEVAAAETAPGPGPEQAQAEVPADEGGLDVGASSPADAGAAELPDWLKGIEMSAPSESAETASAASSAPEAVESPDSSEAMRAGPVREEADIPSWMQNIVEEPTAQEPADVVSEPATPQAEEMPDWMQYIEDQASAGTPEAAHAPTAEESPEPEAAAVAGQPAASIAEEAGESPAPDEIPAWLSTLDEDESREVMPVGEDADLPAWLRGEQANVGVTAEPEPTRASDWQPVQEEQPASAGSTSGAEAGPVTESVAEVAEEPVREDEGAEKEAAAKPERPAEPGLVGARRELGRGDIAAALKNYEKLIRKSRLLEDVIYDLREALYRYPVDVGIWQALGDAYMRANRLQDALDAYTKAEELLR